MKARLNETDSEKDGPTNNVFEEVNKKYKSFSDYIAFNDSDSIALFLLKLFSRALLIFFMLAMSPIVLIILVIAILVAL